MAHPKMFLLSAAAALAIALPAFAPASAQDTKHVKWHDDGTVDLIMDPEYGGTITTTKDELGALFGPGQKPFDGSTITVLTLDSGPKGGISGPLFAFRPIWEDLSGGKVDIALTPITDLYAKMMLDLRQGTGLYDAMIVGAFFYGDLVDGKYILPVDDYMKSGDYPKWSYDVMPASLRNLYTWGGVGYGVLNDADGQVLYYRRDALNDPKWQEQFKKEVGYDMPVPPKTWQQLLDIAKFFNGKNWDSGDADPDSGMVLHLKVGEQGHYHFQSLSAAFAITPGPKVDRYHNVYWFDPTDMTPLINSPGHVKALEFLQELHKTGPAAQVGWSLGEAWDYFLRGKSVFVFSWGDVGALCQDKERSKIQGNCASAVLPSSDTYWDMEKKTWVKNDNPQLVGNTTGGSWHGVISAFGKNPDAAYSFLALMAIKPVSKWLALYGWDGVDPGYKYQMLEPEGEAKLDDYVKAGWDANDVKDYLKAYYENYNAPTMLTYLRIPGAPEYWDIMDKNLSAAMSGSKTAQQALDDTAKTWQEITDRLGRDKQLQLYQTAIGYKP
jgi:multiple sugar transport system substrate-binding protein